MKVKKVFVRKSGECRNCQGNLNRYKRPEDFVPKKGQSYYFTEWDACEDCKRVYFEDSSKVFLGKATTTQDDIKKKVAFKILRDFEKYKKSLGVYSNEDKYFISHMRRFYSKD